ncbi:MAG TPA: hypothetical protein PK141_28050 [Polyangiaceae bacterium]|nr:hypothetical protein [Polyangiaceae bacterium]
MNDAKACVEGPRDCTSGVCSGALCDAPSFTDGVKNGAETDVDCGGGAGAPLCADTKTCTDGPRDCTSGACTGGVCVTE